VLIVQPSKLLGIAGALEVTVETPGGLFTTIDVRLEQGGRTLPLFSLAAPGETTLKQETPDRLRITRPIGRQSLPGLEGGAARVVVVASRSVLFGLRTPTTTASRDVQVRLTPPQVSIASTHHYVNHGGAEMAVYRVSPPDVESGVRVGNVRCASRSSRCCTTRT
jgi:hypothetical protein